ncbi:MCE family protein [Saccharopolyspora sp. HNM0983]|uniref:MCE family protein n=1 Tax=Saccharopolyspora montiporae TaxID=2781240 RepID=A0A929B8I0_9PSEU|nr:MCE family protein [Saccharopolyspora sp. HNM0983]MBE9373780.1 MCE family protein [Saccharopolyspora sp. HNM0983]
MPRRNARDERTSFIVRGLAMVVVLALAGGGVLAGGAGLFRSPPEVTTALSAAAGPIREDTPVQFRGVRVGELTDIDAGDRGSRLTLQLEPAHMGRIPADVQVRLLPRTLFGDQYLDLTAPAGRTAAEPLAAGAQLPPDTSEDTVQLYDTYMRMYRVLDALEPAKLQVALSGMADALRGRGEQIGRMIDEAAALAEESRPMVEGLDEDLRTVAALGDDLRASSPDLIGTLHNAVSLSRTITDERTNISGLLRGGIGATDATQAALDENGERTIDLVESAEPVTELLANNPGALTEGKRGIDAFLDGANRAFATGFFDIRAKASLEEPHPYSARDCPRYPGMSGPNCEREPVGPIGPVGGPQEQEAMRRLGPLLPVPGPEREKTDADSRDAPPSPDLLSLMLGPMVRGKEVVTP